MVGGFFFFKYIAQHENQFDISWPHQSIQATLLSSGLFEYNRNVFEISKQWGGNEIDMKNANKEEVLFFYWHSPFEK